MDGHPDVHAKTIRESCFRHHQLIVNRYFLETQTLAERLSQSANRTAISPGVTARIEQYRSLIPAAQAATPASHDRMPYRVLLGQMAERLRATYDGRTGQYERVEQLVDDLDLIASSLAANRGEHAGLFHVRRMLRRVRTFGFHLATLDVRQNADVHREIVGRALGEGDWAGRPAEERRVRLGTALERDESPAVDLDATGKRALWVLEAMQFCSHRYGRDSIGSYVVSMARDVDDVLSVLLLAQWAGLADGPDNVLPLDVAPLFESVDTLENAGEIIRRLLADPVYRAHLRARSDRQVVMIGYSDSNKAVGIAASRWLLRRAQAAMAEACEAAGVELLVFHGRGGSVSVGGGRIEALVQGLPPGALRGRLRVTEQGESIRERYGQRAIALRSFEQAVNAVATTVAAGRRMEDLDPRWLEAMNLLAAVSQDAYRARVHDDPAFVEFFQAVTPIDVIERMQIGSRPLVRETGTGVEALRAIPWMFAWSQSRHMLPGWFGIGSGLRAVVDRYGTGLLGEMYAAWPFLGGLLDDIEVVMGKADMAIAEFYEQLADPAHGRISATIRAEFELAEAHMLAVKGCARLLDSDPTLQRSIRLRNPYVDPIHLVQVDLLRRWREGGRQDRELFEALVAAVNGIAQGLQGTG
jgi:phosphoenolpyruvate carboxylase